MIIGGKEAGVILPWVDGVCTFLVPAWATAAMIDGRCHRFNWPTPAMYSGYMTVDIYDWFWTKLFPVPTHDSAIDSVLRSVLYPLAEVRLWLIY